MNTNIMKKIFTSANSKSSMINNYDTEKMLAPVMLLLIVACVIAFALTWLASKILGNNVQADDRVERIIATIQTSSRVHTRNTAEIIAEVTMAIAEAEEEARNSEVDGESFDILIFQGDDPVETICY